MPFASPRVCLYPDFTADGIGTYSRALSRHLGIERVLSRFAPLSPQQFLAGLPRGYDLVHVPHFLVPARWGPARCVCTIQDVTPLMLPDAYGRLARTYLAGRIRWSVRHADHLIFTSTNTLRDVERLFGMPRSWDLIPLGIDEPIPAPALAPRPPYPFDYFLCVGRRRPHKNTGTVMDAFASAARHSSAHLVFAGGPDILDDQWRARAAALGVADRVHFAGALSNEDLAAHYRGAIALLYPSRYEGFGLPILEAMSYRCVVITSITASMPEVAGDAAVLVDPADAGALAEAMLRVQGDAALQADLRARGEARARGFSWTSVAERTGQVYQRVLSS